MHQRGCQVSGVQLVYQQAPDGRLSRELRATRDLSPGDVLISVPLDCTLHFVDGGPAATSDSSSSSSDDAGRAALQRLQQGVPAASDSGRGAWQFKVALEVLYHVAQGPASPLVPYIATLPGLCPGIPGPQVAMLFGEEQLQQLQYAPLVADAGAQVYWWQQYSKDVLEQLPGSDNDAFGGQKISQQQLGWALSVAMSRAFGFKQLGGWALVPLVDMANHGPVSNCEIRCDQDGQVKMLANKQVSAGSPILLRYGSHSNSDLLLSYGFVLPDNPADRFRFPLDLDLLLAAIVQFVGGELPPTGRATDGLKQWQRTALVQLGLMPGQTAPGSSSDGPAGAAAALAAAPAAGEGSTAAGAQPESAGPLIVSVGGEPPVSPELLAAVRVVLATERSSIKGRSLQQLGDWQQPLSPAHEAVVMKGLVGLCTVLYKSFPTSIQADKALLAELQQQQRQQPLAAAGGIDSSGSHQPQQPQQEGEESSLLAVERLAVAVQFRLQMKLLLERATKALIVRLKELAAAS